MSAEDEKKTRLAQALRANLARRKAQGRARAAHDAGDEAGGEGGPDGAQDAQEAGAGQAPEGGRIVPPDGAG